MFRLSFKSAIFPIFAVAAVLCLFSCIDPVTDDKYMSQTEVENYARTIMVFIHDRTSDGLGKWGSHQEIEGLNANKYYRVEERTPGNVLVGTLARFVTSTGTLSPTFTNIGKVSGPLPKDRKITGLTNGNEYTVWEATGHNGTLTRSFVGTSLTESKNASGGIISFDGTNRVNFLDLTPIIGTGTAQVVRFPIPSTASDIPVTVPVLPDNTIQLQTGSNNQNEYIISVTTAGGENGNFNFLRVYIGDTPTGKLIINLTAFVMSDPAASITIPNLPLAITQNNLNFNQSAIPAVTLEINTGGFTAFQWKYKNNVISTDNTLDLKDFVLNNVDLWALGQHSIDISVQSNGRWYSRSLNVVNITQ
ncbi:MAG: hypothetical protein FWD28_10035 [Treponema sp.]|nr:hypothetical protein [Treponema sp.]